MDVRALQDRMREVTPNGVSREFENQLTREKVLSREIPWEGYQRADLISERELELIRRYDKKSDQIKSEVLEKEPDVYSELFITFVLKISNPETLQYVLTLINDLLIADPRKVDIFLKLALKNPQFPYPAFLRLLNRWEKDWYINKQACSVLAQLLSKDPSPSTEFVIGTFRWMVEQLRKSNALDVHIATSSLQKLLLKDEYREVLLKEGGFALLITLLNQQQQQVAQNFQILYEITYCIWLMSFNDLVANSVSETKLIAILVDTIKTVIKEKIVRLCISTLRNLLDKPNNNEQMIDAGFMRMLVILSNKKWGDEDIIDDLKTLSESLAKNIVVLSTFDTYKKEVVSGKLEWSPVHKSERFWRENNAKFEDNANQLLLSLHGILRAATAEPRDLAIACFDLGEFARYNPRGRSILTQLGIKMDLLRLMSHENPEVKKEALYAVQKMMVKNYEYL
eukprot:TRINITY_DN6578_c0_g2_i1.p1 TRINITY_DN6578_c0_g2~~TRINITY_DN6578_c0_g2_i1.p1  ORF type:complete len:454 (+),score=104.96 TRINITY_DN6578_c0_g2_i1:991-2352(+)